MAKSFCNVSLSPVRRDSSPDAAQISQLLYGETAEILEIENAFAKIRWQQYELGWVDARHLTVLPETTALEETTVLSKNCSFYDLPEGRMLLSAGSEIKASGNEELKLKSGAALVETALKFKNVPYLSGGRSFFGLDASGFIQLIYKIHGKVLPRNLAQMSKVGESLFFVGESEAGDVAFFSDEEGNMVHAGIMLNSFEIIHADDKVRIDTIDSTGIYSREKNKHTYFLRVVQRFF